MHEMGIAMQVVDIATASIPPGMEDVPVECVNLKIGKLAAVVPDSLRFCFEIIIKDTRLEGAKLDIEEVPVKARCKDCNIEWIIDGPAFNTGPGGAVVAQDHAGTACGEYLGRGSAPYARKGVADATDMRSP